MAPSSLLGVSKTDATQTFVNASVGRFFTAERLVLVEQKIGNTLQLLCCNSGFQGHTWA